MIQSLIQRLARFLDRPLFPWKRLVVCFSISQYLLENWLTYRQYRVYQRTRRPKALEDEVDQETFDKSQAYGRAKARFSFVSSLFSKAESIAMIYFDAFPKLWHLVGLFMANYVPARFSGQITQSLLFIFVFNIFELLTDMPFRYYHSFVLEEAFGFNKMTVSLWLSDLLKEQALTIVLGAPIASAVLAIIQRTGHNFFYYLCLFMLALQAAAITIYPIVIVPLFNKLSPLPEGSLKARVEALARRLKFPLAELQVIDGSKRSAHSNAYFTGLPWKKRIVIYDTLLEKSTDEEVEAVLAHELGHWSKAHTTKLMGITQVHIFFIFALFSVFIDNKSLFADFGFHDERPILIGFLLFNEILAPTEALLKLPINFLTRSMEYEADAFAAKLDYATALGSSLIKLQIQNLSSMDADWLYSSFHYSHPILTERLRAIGWSRAGEKKVERGDSDGKDASEAKERGVRSGRNGDKKEL